MPLTLHRRPGSVARDHHSRLEEDLRAREEPPTRHVRRVNESNKQLYIHSGGRQDEKLGKGKAKNQISQKCAQDLLKIAPDLCYYGRIMIGGHWGSLE